MAVQIPAILAYNSIRAFNAMRAAFAFGGPVGSQVPVGSWTVLQAARHAEMRAALELPLNTVGRQERIFTAVDAWQAGQAEYRAAYEEMYQLSKNFTTAQRASVAYADRAGIPLDQAFFGVDGSLSGLALPTARQMVTTAANDAIFGTTAAFLELLAQIEIEFCQLMLSGTLGPIGGGLFAKVTSIKSDWIAPLPVKRWMSANGSRTTGELDPQLITEQRAMLWRVCCEASGDEGPNKTTVGTLKFRNAAGGAIVLKLPAGLGTFGNVYDPQKKFPTGMLVEQSSTEDRWLIQWTLDPPQTPPEKFPNWSGMAG